MDPLHRQAIVQGLFGILLFVVLIFWPAGTFDYWQGWLFLGIFAAFVTVQRPEYSLGREEPS